MNNNLISVIIPTYKRYPDMVKRALNSVINQSYQNIEVIIVDDSPEDFEGRTAVENMILSLNDNRIRYIKHSSNMGACAARNTGIKESKGEYLAFLDDDDEWLESKLEKQIAMMMDSSIGLVYCKRKIINDTTKVEKIDKVKRYAGRVFDKLMVENFIGSTSFVLVRRKCFEDCGLFDINMKSAQDAEMWLRIAKKYEIVYVNEPLVIYHIHDNERISTNVDNKIKGLELLNIYYSEYLNKHKKVKSIRIIKIVPYYVKAGNIKRAIELYWQAVKLSPFNIKDNLKYLLLFFRELKFSFLG